MPQSAADLRRKLKGRKVLVVEDEYFIAAEISRVLTRFEAETIGPAPDLPTAMRLLDENEAVDGAVLDISLKGEMVYPLADKLRARGIPFMFATGYDQKALPGSYRWTP